MLAVKSSITESPPPFFLKLNVLIHFYFECVPTESGQVVSIMRPPLEANFSVAIRTPDVGSD